MIKNERQYRITQARAEEFRQGIVQSEDERPTSKLHPKLQQAQTDALRGQLQTLERELHEYEDLRSGGHRVLTYASFGELPKALVQARIARGLTQKDLADRLGLDEQKIQDYEATDLTTVTTACVTPNIAPFTCKNVDEFLFWDGIHPTKAGHAILAQETANVLR